MPVRNIKVVTAHPKSIAVMGVDAASANVESSHAAAPTYALADAINNRNWLPSDWVARSLDIRPADWMTMREASPSSPAAKGVEYRRKVPHHLAAVVMYGERPVAEEKRLKERRSRKG